MRIIRVSLVEDDPDIRSGLSQLIDGTAGYKCLRAYDCCETAIEDIEQRPPDVLLMDVALPGVSGVEGVRRIKQLLPEIDIIMLTISEDERTVFDSLCAGACGYLLKTTPPAKILDAVQDVVSGGAPMSAPIARLVAESFRNASESPLTPRETEVLSMLCQAKSYKAIAQALNISQETVHSHLKNIYRKLEVHSRSEAIVKAIHDRLV